MSDVKKVVLRNYWGSRRPLSRQSLGASPLNKRKGRKTCVLTEGV